MGWFDRARGTCGAGGRWRGRTLDREAGRADLAHLEQFATSRRGAQVTGYPQCMRQWSSRQQDRLT